MIPAPAKLALDFIASFEAPRGYDTVYGTTGNANVAHIHAVGVANYSAASGSGFSFLGVFSGDPASAPATQATSSANPLHQHSYSFTQPDHGHALTGQVGSRGDGKAFGIANPFLLVTTYLKL